MASFSGKITASVSAEYGNTLDVGSVNYPINIAPGIVLTNGTGANQANACFTDTRTLTASSSENLDLAGSLVDAFGSTLTFTKIKSVMITAAATNTNDVLVGGHATAAVTFFGDVTDVVKVKPGGCLLLTAPDANGFAVTAITADMLKVANSAGGTSVTYTIVLIGVV